MPASCSGAWYSGVPRGRLGAGHLAARGGQPEVGQPDLAAAVEHDVGRLQVAVQQPLVVDRRQRRRKLPGDLDAFSSGSRPTRFSSEARSSPSMNSIVRNDCPSCSAMS